MDPLRYLDSDDSVEIMIINKVVEQYFEELRVIQKNLATEIINRLSESLSK